MIYETLLVRDGPIEIKRRPARFWCQSDQRWANVDFYDSGRARQLHQDHDDCQWKIQQLLLTDLYSTSSVHLHASHFPCTKLLDKNVSSNPNLDILRVCRQVYREARHIPYSKNTFLVFDLNAISNFLYCLKAWQAESIGHLAFDIVEARGMTIFLAEWNDIFCLMSAALKGLQTVSITIQLVDMPHIWGSSFWDAGLLELDRIHLKSARFVIVDEHLKPQFVYTAGKDFYPSPSTLTSTSPVEKQPQDSADLNKPRVDFMQDSIVSFHRCRDRLREIHSYNPNNPADSILFFRFARSPCPLYVRNLLYLAPQRPRSEASIRHEDRLQRYYPPYKYAKQDGLEDTGEENRVFGYQFSSEKEPPDDNEIYRNILKVHSTRQHLAGKLRASDATFAKPSTWLASVRPAGQQQKSDQEIPMDSSAGLVDFSLPGQWRRRLNEEMFSPFFESFPHMIPDRIERAPWKCHECGTPAIEIKCFDTNVHD